MPRLALLAVLGGAGWLFAALLAEPGGAVHLHSTPLMISEVHAVADLESDDDLERVEWVELHNLWDRPVSLDGWFLEDAISVAMLPDVVLAAGASVVVIGANADLAVPAGEMLIVLDSARIGTGLRNAGDRVALIDPFGARRDAVSWGDVRTPFFVEVLAATHSITRTESGGVRLVDRLTPWAVEERIAPPDPDTPPMHGSLAIVESVSLEGADGGPAGMVIRNVTDQPLLTVNWRLSVGARAVTLPSVRIEAQERRAFTAERLGIDGWLNAGAGRLVLRDAHGRWLSTASWGADTTFHQIEPSSSGGPIQFTNYDRVRPTVPWYRWFELQEVLVVSDVSRERVAAARRRPIGAGR